MGEGGKKREPPVSSRRKPHGQTKLLFPKVAQDEKPSVICSSHIGDSQESSTVSVASTACEASSQDQDSQDLFASLPSFDTQWAVDGLSSELPVPDKLAVPDVDSAPLNADPFGLFDSEALPDDTSIRDNRWDKPPGTPPSKDRGLPDASDSKRRRFTDLAVVPE
eukprot:10692852-Karenia_brevis.AAC.1